MGTAAGGTPGPLQRLFQATAYAVLTISPEGLVTRWNRGAQQLYGYTAAEAIAMPYQHLYPSPAQASRPALNLRVAAVQGRIELEEERVGKDGRPFRACCELTFLGPAGAGAGEVAEISRAVREAAEGDPFQAEPRVRPALLARWMGRSEEGLLILDAHGRVTFVNDAAGHLLDTPPRELDGRRYDDPAWGLESWGGPAPPGDPFSFLRVSRTGEPASGLEAVKEKADGTLRFLVVHSEPAGQPPGRVEGVMVTLRDVTEAQRHEAERRARERLAEVSRRQAEVAEAERRRLGRELHDEVGGALNSLRLLLDAATALPPNRAAAHLEEAKSLASGLQERVREVSRSLRPPLLEELGMLRALQALTGNAQRQSGLRIDLHHAGLDRRFPPAVEAAAYRILQEALTNAARHSRASWVVARLWVEEGALHLSIADGGDGFDPERAEGAGGSLGLEGMRDRALSLGGRFEVDSRPGTGVTIQAELPLLD